MHIKPYILLPDSSGLHYEFISKSKNGKEQKKIVEFFELKWPSVTGGGISSIFNLGFGDALEDGEIDDQSVTNNGDMEEVLRTVAQAAEEFFKHHHSSAIFFKGSSLARTRLYRIMLNKYYDDISERFVIFGQSDNGLEVFNRNSRVKYQAFLVKLK